MREYFITSDVHGFYDEFISALDKAGFSLNNSEHFLIICGDLFDRGKQAKELLKYLIHLDNLGRLILIRGNHEDLLDDCLEEIKAKRFISPHHWSNGTVDTISQLTNIAIENFKSNLVDYDIIKEDLKDYYNLINKAKNYYELGDYIFVHGWIPHVRDYKDLENVSDEEWRKAAWLNGMEEWNYGWRFADKTIVCGHWHTSFGNYFFHNKGSGQFESDSDFNPFIDEGIIALDACTAYTRFVNIIKICEN